MSPEQYSEIRARLVAAGYADEIEWAQTVKPPETADDFAGEAIWVVCCSGFKEQRARTTQAAAMKAIAEGRSATEVFPKSGKGRAIDLLWKNRETYFRHLKTMVDGSASPSSIIAWIATLPYVGGPILRYHFAKNMGVDCAKPDVHLTRIAEHYKTTPETLCAELSRVTGDRIATVDLVIWRAANLGLINTRALSSPAAEG